MDQIIKLGEMTLLGVRLNQKLNSTNVVSTMKKKMMYKDFHNKMGH